MPIRSARSATPCSRSTATRNASQQPYPARGLTRRTSSSSAPPRCIRVFKEHPTRRRTAPCARAFDRAATSPQWPITTRPRDLHGLFTTRASPNLSSLAPRGALCAAAWAPARWQQRTGTNAAAAPAASSCRGRRRPGTAMGRQPGRPAAPDGVMGRMGICARRAQRHRRAAAAPYRQSARQQRRRRPRGLPRTHAPTS